MSMSGRILLCIFIYLICGQQQVTSTDYHLADAIDDLNYFIPGSKVVFSTVIKLWTVYGEVKQLIDSNRTAAINQELEKINNGLADISDQLVTISYDLNSISDDVKDVKDLISDKVIDDLPKEFGLDNKMITIYKEINKINSLFDKFLRYNAAPKKYENSTLLNFANKIIDHGLSELPSILNQIHDILTDKHSGVNMLNILANRKLATTMMCKRQESAQHFINNLYNNIMIVEMKNLLMTEFAYSIKIGFSNNSTSYLTEMIDANIDSYNRTSKSIVEIKKAMYQAPRDFWNCDPIEHKEGITYAKLGPVFQAYVMNEKDAGTAIYLDKYTNKCGGTCADRTQSNDLCRSTYCKDHGRKCTGAVYDCKSFAKELQICLAAKNSTRRYEYIELKDKNDVFGLNQTCWDSAVTVGDKTHYFNKCEYCLCTCENIDIDIDRYFSLKNVISDIKDNYVVTGVRFTKSNNIFHIQIKQGKLVKNGNINGSTVQWKPVDNFSVNDGLSMLGVDYHNITWQARTVYLDTYESPLNQVLTGLRFRLKDDSLKLEIQLTPFNFSTGELKEYESKWMTKLDNGRAELNLDNRNIGTSTFINLPDSNNHQYINFTTSSLNTDVGQTVVPFIDLQEITSSPTVPLSGAGLIHRGDRDSAGFLSLKVFTYNYAPYIQN